MKMTIGANIKRLRTAKNITQEQLSVAMNVTCAAVSKWERGETFPDITLLQPLAYYFDISIDELMGYNQEKIQENINETIACYRSYWKTDYNKAREIITKAYQDYPNDYWIMHYYMWNIGGDMADNDPAVLISHKDEFLDICDKIFDGCTDEGIRLNAWNMRAKILHAEGKTEEALKIYESKFSDWYTTGEQKTEQLFAKHTKEYFFHVQKNMYELVDFAADKLGRTVFFDPSYSMDEKFNRALKYGNILIAAFEETGEAFFLVLAKSFLGRMENDFVYRGGTDEQIIALMEKNLSSTKKLEEIRSQNEAFNRSLERYNTDDKNNLLTRILDYHYNPKNERRSKLLKNQDYVSVLNKYR